MSKLDTVPKASHMRRLGFTDHLEGYWYWSKRVGTDTTFNLTIDKTTGSYDTVVLNEMFGQPEHYGHMIGPYRAQVIANVDVILHELKRDGVSIEFDHAEYGVTA